MCMAATTTTTTLLHSSEKPSVHRPPILLQDRCCYSLKNRRRMSILADFSWCSWSYARLIAILTLMIAFHHYMQHAKKDNGTVSTSGSNSLTTSLIAFLLPKVESSLSSELTSTNSSWLAAAAAFWAFMVAYILLPHKKCRLSRDHQVANDNMSTLRRAASITNGMSNSLTEAVMEATACCATTRQDCLSMMRSSVSLTSMRLFGIKSGKVGVGDCDGRCLAISQKECFLPLDVLTNLTLHDIQHVFLYAVQSNATDFDVTTFLASSVHCSSAFQTATSALEKVLVSSRGIHVQPSHRPTAASTTKSVGIDDVGSMDALAFCASIRLFAEWRSLRLVPDGNPRYGVGMSLARRDLLHNVTKMEQAAHAWMGFHQGVYDYSSNEIKASSPTIRQLLQHEIELRVHAHLPVLADKSAASGLLWAKRQIHYQTLLFENISQIPFAFPSSKAAVNAAYEEVYSRYHGFFVRRIFQTSFEAAPDANVILNHMNAPYLTNPRCTSRCDEDDDDDDDETARTENAANESSSSDEEDDDEDDWIHHPVDDNENSAADEDDDVVAYLETPVAASSIPSSKTTTASTMLPPVSSPLEELGEHLVHEWCKFVGFWGQCAGEYQFQQQLFQQQQCKHPRTAFASSPALRMSSLSIQDNDDDDDDDELDDSCEGRVVAGGKCSTSSSRSSKNRDVADIHGYVQVMHPMIRGLDKLIAALNMNDPTKV